ncbi:hypothetical protein ACTRXD_07530 [Nitrospira sp. T9]|uniref:hypothetical protein n=1 Tax=unclassified Nitrospira TaxID=2652172 RepID=UPI003F99A6E5
MCDVYKDTIRDSRYSMPLARLNARATPIAKHTRQDRYPNFFVGFGGGSIASKLLSDIEMTNRIAGFGEFPARVRDRLIPN